MENERKSSSASRRRFISDTARTACGVALLGTALGFYGNRSRATPATALRPPGALDESEFAGACIRCGMCVRDCPYDTLRLARPEDDLATGTPYFEAREVPCEMCDDIPCVKACPTGALNPVLTDINEARMGLAVLVDQENCLNFLGLRCDVCYRVCPAIDTAITLERQHNTRTDAHTMFLPVVHSEHCTGCGKCEKSCVLESAAIKVLPFSLARGAPGDHYQMGWIEKQNAGGSLIEEQGIIDLPDRMPESPGSAPTAPGMVPGSPAALQVDQL